MAYVEAGPSDGPAVLLLHGEPTWGYLYRRMIPPLVEAGFRCIAPDLIGFGRSDKPVDGSVYTYSHHVAWMKEFLAAIDFKAPMFASQNMEFMDAGRMLQRATSARELTDAEMDAYRAPFPDEDHMAGAREFPTPVPITPEHGGVSENRAAWDVFDRWEKPLLTLWCPNDPVLGPLHHEFIERVPGAADQPHQEFTPGGHFIQDDRGEDIAAALLAWLT